PVLGGQADREALAPLLPPAGQDRAAPHVFHPRAESMLVDAPPIARAIRRTHTFLSRGGEGTLSRARRSRLTFPHTARTFGPALTGVPPIVELGVSRLPNKTG